ncbi:hypothetical protein RRG08_036498 [Elysia crispata]|uniref:Uncharacterized protein n=1 Tax=Elysia crispata TaxID=231223 RepID=A0AAE0ZK34_9GAST|nr:hypothetical protein RRG08_036498 [Elysia crispata]
MLTRGPLMKESDATFQIPERKEKHPQTSEQPFLSLPELEVMLWSDNLRSDRRCLGISVGMKNRRGRVLTGKLESIKSFTLWKRKTGSETEIQDLARMRSDLCHQVKLYFAIFKQGQLENYSESVNMYTGSLDR